MTTEAPAELTQIGRYQIVKELGQGAMATVFLAELQTFGGFKRKVALKVVRSEFARDPKFSQLMAREAMIGSYLQHPNIVETLEFNEVDGRMFLALEFIEGQTVEELLEQNKSRGETGIPLDLALEIQVQILKGLSYAHNLPSPETGERMGIIHRDLKPGNIMVSRHGVVKVMDFGIAKAKVACATITAAGQVRGTPIYMAPEQVMGKPLDGGCDQFAAATVLYELVTGEQLFIAKNLIEIMRRVSRAEVGDACAKLDRYTPGLGSVAARMWKADPTHRFEDCVDAAVAIEDLLPSVKAALARGESLQPSPEPPAAPPPDPGKGPNLARLGPPADVDETAEQVDTPAPLRPKRKRTFLEILGLKKPPEPEPKKRRKKRKRSPGETGPLGADGQRRRKRKKRPDQAASGAQPAPKPLETTRPDHHAASGPVPTPPPATVAEASPPAPPPPRNEPERSPAPAPSPAAAPPPDSESPREGGRLEPNPLLAGLSAVGDESVSSIAEAPSAPPTLSGDEATPPAERPAPRGQEATASTSLVFEDSTFGESTSGIAPVTDSLGILSAPSAPALKAAAGLAPDKLAVESSRGEDEDDRNEAPEQPTGAVQDESERPTLALQDESERPTVALTSTSERPAVGLRDPEAAPTTEEEEPASDQLDPFFFED